MNKLPKILQQKIVAESKLFKIEEMQLQFSNGNERTYERLVSRRHGAVLIVPLLDPETLLLIREYCGGTGRYEISFPKGIIDDGESKVEAANRELMEEVGYGAKKLTILKDMSASPGYWGGQATVIIAQDLYPKTLAGDEPEPLEVIPWQIKDYRSLLNRDDFTEARSIAALLWIKEIFS